ncbi:MAG: 5'/3'-nucleotidase SurE [Shewanellaceae bacterium]|nr:5'/3'-nucleotidase SurE [Shewanellaceae bacterium]
MLNVLLSNDDGIHATGIQTLAAFLKSKVELMVAAPDRDCSGTSHSVTLRQPLYDREVAPGQISVQGTPADSVHLALRQWYQQTPPDLVISGINHGANLGDDVLYSGTVAAAIEGRSLALPALAISLAGTQHFATAAQVVWDVISMLPNLQLPPRCLLNINVPDRPYAELKGMRITRLGYRLPAEALIKADHPVNKGGWWLGPLGQPDDQADGTDFAAVAAGFVSITPLQTDLTAHAVLSKVESWLEAHKPSKTMQQAVS